ncbi:hypothetical protein OVY01_18445 [Robbsia sp. Bb-Pol-6]|uniref:Uncharacterized protein n=1 Tax=Robbsia betulipollinis TaxID=2981849 RepID=A0ABT3ZRE2_9BURK|nr:hypothetical protein [Robbsia betulipollinis]MCY0389129.1 hypothetical protein [Robbsia betulipollinis]
MGSDEEYEAAKIRLARRVRQMASASWTPTPLRNDLTDLADQLEALTARLQTPGAAQDDIERIHDAKSRPFIAPDEEGYPMAVLANHGRLSYAGTLGALDDLVQSARDAIAALPDPREKPAIGFAALQFLHLRFDFERWPVALSNDSSTVTEFGTMCASAGLVLSPERYRGALSAALKGFDPEFNPDDGQF